MALLPLAARLSLRSLIVWPLLANAAAMASAIGLAAVTRAGGGAVMAVTLPAVGLTGATTACLQAGTFALASHFAPRHMQVRLSPMWRRHAEERRCRLHCQLSCLLQLCGAA